jgi:hypothetical protein
MVYCNLKIVQVPATDLKFNVHIVQAPFLVSSPCRGRGACEFQWPWELSRL